MSNNHKLGKFIRPVEIDGTTFFVRGLTLGEYTDLSMRGMLQRYTEELWVEITLVGLVGWDNLLDVDEYGNSRPVPFSIEAIEELPDAVFSMIGRAIYETQTELSDEEREKFIASTRFLHFCSEPKNKSTVETFNCETCLKKGMARSRPCGRFTADEINEQHRLLNNLPGSSTDRQQPSSGEDNLTPPKQVKNRYKASRASITPKHPDSIAVKRTNSMVLGGHQYSECPISLIDPWISHLTGVLYHASKSNLLFINGGMADQPYKLYQAQRVVAGESSKIEAEEMDALHKKKK